MRCIDPHLILRRSAKGVTRVEDRPIPIQCNTRPSVLYRCFSTREHAEQFLGGRIRFGYLQHYQAAYESPRRDADEGAGRVREWRDDREAMHFKAGRGKIVSSPGEITRHAGFSNITFICCCTNPPSGQWSRVLADFGGHVVRISDPMRFCRDVRDALSERDRWQRHGNIALFEVAYDKDELRPATADPPDGEDVMRLAVAQKSRRYEHQFEYRVLLISYAAVAHDASPEDRPPDHIEVTLGRPLPYAELLATPPT